MINILKIRGNANCDCADRGKDQEEPGQPTQVLDRNKSAEDKQTRASNICGITVDELDHVIVAFGIGFTVGATLAFFWQ